MAECTYKIKCIKGTKTQCVHFDRLKPAVATSNPVREDLVAVPTSTSTKTASPDTVPLEWADEILSLDSDDEEAEELDHRVADDGIMEAVPGPEPAAVEPPAPAAAAELPRRYPMRNRQPPDRYGPYLQH